MAAIIICQKTKGPYTIPKHCKYYVYSPTTEGRKKKHL